MIKIARIDVVADSDRPDILQRGRVRRVSLEKIPVSTSMLARIIPNVRRIIASASTEGEVPVRRYPQASHIPSDEDALMEIGPI